MKTKLKDIRQCLECGSFNIAYNKKRDEVLCKDCGLIFSELTPEQERKFEKASDAI